MLLLSVRDCISSCCIVDTSMYFLAVTIPLYPSISASLRLHKGHPPLGSFGSVFYGFDLLVSLTSCSGCLALQGSSLIFVQVYPANSDCSFEVMPACGALGINGSFCFGLLVCDPVVFSPWLC